jgi:hypothetical protein
VVDLAAVGGHDRRDDRQTQPGADAVAQVLVGGSVRLFAESRLPITRVVTSLEL